MAGAVLATFTRFNLPLFSSLSSILARYYFRALDKQVWEGYLVSILQTFQIFHKGSHLIIKCSIQ